MASNTAPYRAMLVKLLKIYRKKRCLWDIMHKDYNSKYVRQAAADKLLNVVRTVEPTANRTDVLKKLNSVRTCYKKERKKVEYSMMYNNEVYEPKLWYYHLLTFLDDDETSDNQNEEDSDEDIPHETKEEYHATDDEEEINFVTKIESPIHTEYLESESESNDQLIASSSKRAPKRTLDESSLTSNVVKLVDKCLKRFKEDDFDRHDIFGKSIAAKMRYLDHKQLIIAEKLINDVMYEAESGNLTTQFKLARSDLC